MDSITAAQQRAVDVEEVGVLLIPGKSLREMNARRLGSLCARFHVLQDGVASALAQAQAMANRAIHRTFATRRTLEARSNFRQAQPQFGHRTAQRVTIDRKSTRLNSSHLGISYAVFCLKKKTT